MPWCLSDAFALAEIGKRDDSTLDYEKLVQEIWSEMQAENES